MIDVTAYWDEILKAARTAGFAYGGQFERDDIAQGIALDMLEHPDRYTNIGGTFRQLIINRAGLRYCAEQAAMFLNTADQYTYSSEELKKLLPRYCDGSWPDGMAIEMLDLDHAMGMLTGSQRKVIEKKYRDGERLASKYDQNKHSEAIRYLTFHVNGRTTAKQMPDFFHEGPGARKSIRNEDPEGTIEDDHGPSAYQGADGLRSYDRVMRRVHADDQPSRYVVNSPWRQAHGRTDA